MRLGLAPISTVLRLTLRGHAKPVEFVRFTPDESRLITASSHLGDHALCLWDLEGPDPSANVQKLPNEKYRILNISFTPDCRWVFAADEASTLRMSSLPFDGSLSQKWPDGKIENSTSIENIGNICRHLAMDPAGRFLLAARSSRPGKSFRELKPGIEKYELALDLIDLSTLPSRPRLIPLPFPPGTGMSEVNATSVAISPDGDRFFVGFDGLSFLGDVRKVLCGHYGNEAITPLTTPFDRPVGVDIVEFGRDSRWLALASTQRKIVHVLPVGEGAIAPVPRISTKSGPFSPGEWLESLPGSARGY
jgi:WD40 repeat protein